MGQMVRGLINDGGYSHAVDTDDGNRTLCGETDPSLGAHGYLPWADAPQPKCERCKPKVAQLAGIKSRTGQFDIKDIIDAGFLSQDLTNQILREHTGPQGQTPWLKAYVTFKPDVVGSDAPSLGNHRWETIDTPTCPGHIPQDLPGSVRTIAMSVAGQARIMLAPDTASRPTR